MVKFDHENSRYEVFMVEFELQNLKSNFLKHKARYKKGGGGNIWGRGWVAASGDW